MVRSFGSACPPPSGSLCSQRRTLSAVLPMSDGRSLLEIGQEVRRTNSGPQKTGGFLTATDGQLLDVENHRRTHSRFVGIPKGSPFGASFSILSVRAESMAPGGPIPLGSGKVDSGKNRRLHTRLRRMEPAGSYYAMLSGWGWDGRPPPGFSSPAGDRHGTSPPGRR